MGLTADLYHNWQIRLPMMVIGPKNPDWSIPSIHSSNTQTQKSVHCNVMIGRWMHIVKFSTHISHARVAAADLEIHLSYILLYAYVWEIYICWTNFYMYVTVYCSFIFCCQWHLFLYWCPIAARLTSASSKPESTTSPKPASKTRSVWHLFRKICHCHHLHICTWTIWACKCLFAVM